MKVAIVGGSFDPVHLGHLQMAHQAKEQLGVSQVWFLPTKKTPLKDRQLTDDQDRLAMLKMALEPYPDYKVCTIELEREGTSYTVDTLKELHARYPDHEFFWLIGNDQLEQFDRWKEPDTLVCLAQFVCFDRDGKLGNTAYPIRRIHMVPMPVSSSEIRRGKKLNYLAPQVLDYIYQHRLYLKGFLEERLKPKRVAHSFSVAKLCEEFACAHDLDPDRAYLIGCFHDIAKNMTEAEMKPWMEILCPENMHYPCPVWHGFVASEIVDRIFGIHDCQIRQAIYHHVLGTSTDPYAMIIFCADKLDPLRGYPVQKQIDLVKQDLLQGFWMVKEENQKYLEGKE